ncbi:MULTISPECIES: EAL domain-containing protein [unclassified Janthinobacterium]|uniref:EAL domain-containing protein n=1 Tax=unclassified Janthinobacterium TaxID=2610881 RepID=UPI000344DF31|nr:MULTISPECIES: EAL domain-containing protein [unclassified Janthinobacterium]MEC5160385.1 diguanylate cyclase (GGDEF)-like protein/PAS domain S-box-containing protein [Janthinobacterium sp. CG_S6]
MASSDLSTQGPPAASLPQGEPVFYLGHWQMRASGAFQHWSDEAGRILALAPSRFPRTLDDFLAFVHADDRADLAQAFADVLRGGAALNHEHRIVRPDGEQRHLYARGRLETDARGQRLLAGSLHDVTESKLGERTLRQNEALVHIAGRIAHLGGWEVELPSRQVVWSEEIYALFDMAPGPPPSFEQAMGLCVPESRARLRAAFEGCAQVGLPYDEELEVVSAGGRRLWVRALGQAVRGDGGVITRVRGAMQDISGQKRAEERANRLAARLTTTLESITDAFFTFDHAWRFTYLNRQAELLLQRSRGELLGKVAWEEFREAVGGVSYGAYHRALRDNCAVEFVEYYAPLARWLEGHAYPSDEGLAVHFRDISARKHAELALVRSNRALQLLSRCNEALIREGNEAALVERICRIAVDVGGYRMAWVGYANDDAARSISVEAHAGEDDLDYLRSITLSWSDAAAGPGECPAGRVVRAAAPLLLEHLEQLDACQPWVKVALAAGYRAAAYLPLRDGQRCFGLLALYSGEPFGDPAREIGLLGELADNLAFGVGNIRVRDAQRRIQAHMRDQASLLDQARDAIIVRSVDQRVLYWNKSAQRLYGWSQDEVLGRSVDALLDDDEDALEAATAIVLRSGEWSGEVTRRGKDGSALTVEVRWTLVSEDDGRPKAIMSIDTDITERKAAEREIQYLAFYDALTGLPNRRLMLDRLLHAMAVSGRARRTGALLFIDLDNFKTLNDTLGHDQGDLLLQQVASRLQAAVYDSDTVARFGGDEFVVMVEELSRDRVVAAAQTTTIGERLLLALNQPYLLKGGAHHSSCSIGATLFEHDGDVGELLKRADLAMYQAKAAGRNTLRFFDPQMQVAVHARVALEADLRQGLQRDEFYLHYQPQLGEGGRITGAEALVRWRHPQRGVVSPAAFIPLAEETGLILALGQWVLETACAQLVAWSEWPATARLSVAVNVSARQLRHPDFVADVLAVLASSGADPALLKLELTESLLVDDVEVTIAKMVALKGRGVGFSLDDFGTGYSSLSYLKRLPLEQLKIDQSFVADVLTDPNDAAIVRTIVALGQSLGLSVMAEGVETEAQRDFLLSHGCGAYQGYLLSRPLSAEQFHAFIATAGAA